MIWSHIRICNLFINYPTILKHFPFLIYINLGKSNTVSSFLQTSNYFNIIFRYTSLPVSSVSFSSKHVCFGLRCNFVISLIPSPSSELCSYVSTRHRVVHCPLLSWSVLLLLLLWYFVSFSQTLCQVSTVTFFCLSCTWNIFDSRRVNKRLH